MAKIFPRRMFFFAISVLIFMLTDMLMDWGADDRSLAASLVHLLLAISIILTGHILMQRAMKSYVRAEEILGKAKKELELEVEERTAELKRANKFLVSEIAEREKAEVARETLLVQNEAARVQALELVNDLHLANNMLTTLIETLPAGMVIVDNQDEIVMENSTARAILKKTQKEDNHSFGRHLALRDKEGNEIPIEQMPLVCAMKGVVTSGLEVECLLASGKSIYLLIAASPVHDRDGNITHAVEIMQDITPLKQLENTLRQSEEKYRSQFDAFPESVTVWDCTGHLLMQNQVSARNLGGKPEDFLGKTMEEISPINGKNYLERITRVIDSGETDYQEDQVEMPGGDLRIFQTFTQRIQNSNGYAAAQIISYEITDRRRIEEAIRSSEEKFSTVFHHAPYPISIIRLEDGIFVEANQAYCKMLKHDLPDVLGKPWDQFNINPNPADLQKIYQLMETTGHVTDHELQLEVPGFPLIVLLLSIIPISIGGKACVLLIGHDITERKQSEEALRLAQVELSRGLQERITLQERQRLARELHDSVSQALYGISLGAHTALTLFETDRIRSHDALNYVLELSQAGMTEMRALIFELRPESLKNEGVVVAISKQAAALRARHSIEVDMSPCEEPPVSLEIKEAIYRIALEAIQNALKHARCTHIQIDLRDEETGLYLEVQDNGIGFDSSLEYPGHLGLHSMRERAAKISANIQIMSTLGRGTAIYVHVPVSQADPAQT
jgi:PAS domain S-box-containing protein